MKTFNDFMDEHFEYVDEEEMDEAGMMTRKQSGAERMRFKMANMGSKAIKKKTSARRATTKLRRKQAMRMRSAAGIKSVGKSKKVAGKLKLRKAFTSKGYAGKKKQKAAAGSKPI